MIIVHKLESNFYNKALDRIDEELKSDISNERLIDQKLYYCEQLEWPTTCISALDTYKSQHGMSNQLLEQYVAYYSKHQQYQLLINTVDSWSQAYDLKDQFHQPLIEALVSLRKKKRASIELRNYMIGKTSPIDLEFASRQYLLLGDTTMSTFYLGRLFKTDSTNELMVEYGKVLITLGFKQKGFFLLESMTHHKMNNEDYHLMLARLYEKHENLEKAIATAKSYTATDTISYLISDWYLRLNQWDSAVNYINTVIERDSANTKAIWKKARMYENRGLLVSSLKFYNELYNQNPTDTITSYRIDLIQRKIAYLQRKKFEESKIQIREIEPLKIDQ